MLEVKRTQLTPEDVTYEVEDQRWVVAGHILMYLVNNQRFHDVHYTDFAEAENAARVLANYAAEVADMPLPKLNRERDVTLRFRVTKTERDQLIKAAEAEGVTLSQYIRSKILDASPKKSDCQWVSTGHFTACGDCGGKMNEFEFRNGHTVLDSGFTCERCQREEGYKQPRSA